MSPSADPCARQLALAPVSGIIRDLAEVPDPVFAEQMVGPGIAIEPSQDQPIRVLAPATGVLTKALPHALLIAVEDAGPASGVLVHLGLDTVRLEGAGFTQQVRPGARVHSGTHLSDWDPQPALAAGLDLISPVVILGAAPERLRALVRAGSSVRAGQALLRWA